MTTEMGQKQTKPKTWLWPRLGQNPVTIKELRSRMRGRRAFVVLTIYLLLMSGFISLIYQAYAAEARTSFGPNPRQTGKVLFAAVLSIQVFLVIFIAPAFTAGAITGEKERQTFDLLRTTLLSANSFVMGKLLSALSYVYLLIFASIPLQSIAFLLGGLSLVELVVSQLLIVVAAVTFALWGLYCSSAMRTTLAASVTTFAGALFLTVGLPVLVFLFAFIINSFRFGFGRTPPSWQFEALLQYAGLALAATNLPATLILSEIFLLEESTLFLFRNTVSGHTIWLFSPWPLFLALYIFLALLLYWACVRRVRRVADK